MSLSKSKCWYSNNCLHFKVRFSIEMVSSFKLMTPVVCTMKHFTVDIIPISRQTSMFVTIRNFQPCLMHKGKGLELTAIADSFLTHKYWTGVEVVDSYKMEKFYSIASLI
jgi:hypothetical protein